MTSEIKKIKCDLRNNVVNFNSSADKFYWVKRPKHDELVAAIQSHFEVSIDIMWDDLLSKSKKGPYIKAFEVIRGRKVIFQRLKANKIKETCKAPKGENVAKYCQNLSLEKQRELFESLRPKNKKEFLEIFVVTWLNGRSLLDLYNIYKTCRDIDCFLTFINDLFNSSTGNKSGDSVYLITFFFVLRSRGFLLFPIGFATLPNRNKMLGLKEKRFCGKLSDFCMSMSVLDGQLKGSGHAERISLLIQTCILSSTLESEADISAEYLEEIEKALTETTPIPFRTIGQVRKAIATARNRKYPESALFLGQKKKDKGIYLTTGTFDWLTHKCPELSGWEAPLAEFLKGDNARTKHGKIANLNLFCNFLLTLDNPPKTPSAVIRHLHIYDHTRTNRNLFIDWLLDKV